MAFDEDDRDTAALLGKYKTPLLAGLSLTLLLLVVWGLIEWVADACDDRCSRQFDLVGADGKVMTGPGEATLRPEEGRVIDNVCYCVTADGVLRVPTEPPRPVKPGVLREAP